MIAWTRAIRLGLFWSATLIVMPSLARGSTSTAGLVDFQGRRVEWMERSNDTAGGGREFSGPGIDLGLDPGAPVSAISQEVERFVRHNDAALGAVSSELRLVQSERVFDHDYLTFEQEFDGIPIAGSRLDVRLGRDRRISAIFVRLHSTAERPSRAALPEAILVDAARRAANAPSRAAASNPTIHLEWRSSGGKTTGGLTLVARVTQLGDFETPGWVVDVDARTGEFLGDLPVTLHAGTLVLGDMNAAVRTPQHRSDPLVPKPMPFQHVFIDGVPLTTDALGRFSIERPTAGPYSVAASMTGPYVQVYETGTGQTAQWSGSFVPTIFSSLEWPNAEALPSERTSFYYAMRMYAHLQEIAPWFRHMDWPLALRVNYPGTTGCANTGFSRTQPVYSILFGAKSECDAGQEADAISHEYFHAVTDTIYRIVGWTLLENDVERSMHEAFSDYFAASLTDDPQIGEGIGDGFHVRTCDNETQAAESGDIYAMSGALSGALWHMRQALPRGAAQADSLVFAAILGRPRDYVSVLRECLVADDDDSDLTDGTPNSGVILQQFARHGIHANFQCVALRVEPVVLLADSVAIASLQVRLGVGSCTTPTNQIVTLRLPPVPGGPRIVGADASGALQVLAQNGQATASLTPTDLAGTYAIEASVPGFGADTTSVSYAPVFQPHVIREDALWAGNVYLDADCVVDFGARLTIAPGTHIHMTPYSSAWDTTYGVANRVDLIVYHALTAGGGSSSDSTIGFGPYGVAPSPGTWGSLILQDSSIDALCTFRGCRIEGGTRGLQFLNARPTVTNSRIGLNAELGIRVEGSVPGGVFENDTLSFNNGIGVEVAGSSPQILNCVFEGQAGPALVLGGSAAPLITGCRIVGEGITGMGRPRIEGNDLSAAGPAINLYLAGDTTLVRNNVLGSSSTVSLQPFYTSEAAGGHLELDGNTGGSFTIGASSLGGVLVTALVRHNTNARQIYLQGAGGGCYPGSAGTLVAEVDSNIVVAGTGDGIVVQGGDPYCGGGPSGSMTVTLRGNTVSGKTGAGVRVEPFNASSLNVQVTLEGNAITGCGYGVKTKSGAVTLRSNTITGSSQWGLYCENTSGSFGGSPAWANDIQNNGGKNLYSTGSVVQATHNFWGTTDEDQLVSWTGGGAINYSPWMDATHSTLYATAYVSGPQIGDRTWSGEVRVVGDIFVPLGSRLTITPGTVVKLWANSSQWDTLGVTSGRCDLIAEGVLKIQGGATDSVVFEPWAPLQTVMPAPGMWGRLRYLDSTDDTASVIEGARLRWGTNGVELLSASPSIRSSVFEGQTGPAIVLAGTAAPLITGCRVVGEGISGAGRPTVEGNAFESTESGNATAVNVEHAGGTIRVANNALLGGIYAPTVTVRAQWLSGAPDGTVEIEGNSGGTYSIQAISQSSVTLNAVVRHNMNVRQIYLQSAGGGCYSGSSGGSIFAEVDSNTVVAGNGDGIVVQGGDPYCGGSPSGTTSVMLRGNTVTGKTGAGVRVEPYGYTSLDVQVTLERNTITSCGYGVKTRSGTVTLRSNLITGSSQWGVHSEGTAGSFGGSLAWANDIFNNGGRNLYSTGSVVQATHNYWGTTNEDQLVSWMGGGAVNYSPWTDAAHATSYTTAYVSGVLSGDQKWTGEVRVVGDILVPLGSRLTITPGTVVKLWANSSQWDTLGVTSGRCDLIAEGVLKIQGGATDSVVFEPWAPLQTVTPAPGMWGRVRYVDTTDDTASVVDGARLRWGTNGVELLSASPPIRNSVFEGLGGPAVLLSGGAAPWITACRIVGEGISGTGRPRVEGNVFEYVENGNPIAVSVEHPGGTIRIANNALLGGVNAPSVTVRSQWLYGGADGAVEIEGNTGGSYAIQAYSQSPVTMNALVRHNTNVRQIYLQSAAGGCYSGSSAGSLFAEIDSNSVVAGSGDGIVIQGGDPYCGGGPSGTTQVSVRRNIITGKTGVGIRIEPYSYTSLNVQVTLEDNTIANCGYGVKTKSGAVTLRNNTITGSGQWGLYCEGTTGSFGGSLAWANDIFDNGGRNLYSTGSVVQATHNYWGTTDENELVLWTGGGALNYSPWTDATHSTVYSTSYVSGVMSGDRTWSGEVRVVGDIFIPLGSRLTITPGTVVKLRANSSQWDTLGVTSGRCDLIAEGVLKIQGGATDSVVFEPWAPLQTVIPAPGMWGRVRYMDSTDDTASVVDGARLRWGTNGIELLSASPAIRNSVFEALAGPAVVLSGSAAPWITGCRIVGEGVSGTGRPRVEGNAFEYAENGNPNAVSVEHSGGTIRIANNELLGGVNAPSVTVRAQWLSGAPDGTVEIEGNSGGTYSVQALSQSSVTLNALVRYNTDVRQIYLQSAAGGCYSGSSSGSLFAEVDSNRVVAGSGDGIVVQGGDPYCGGSPSGSTTVVLRGNTISGKTGAGVRIRPYSYTSLNVQVTLVGNTISNCGYGVMTTSGDVTLRGNQITSSNQWGVTCDRTALDVQDNDIVGNSLGGGLLCTGPSSVNIEANRLRFNTVAIECSDGANPHIHENLLACNINYGVLNQAAGPPVDAVNNWWGSSSGPFSKTQNTGGTGSSVSDNVLFVPWTPEGPQNPPQPFDLVEPANGSSVTSLWVRLSWNVATDIDCWDEVAYFVRYSTDPQFATQLQHGPIHATQDSILVSAGQTYYWRVLAVDSRGDSTGSSGDHFSFAIPAWVDVSGPSIPVTFNVTQNWPNPFESRTAMRLEIPRSADVVITIFDVAGRRVRLLARQRFEAGSHVLAWDGRADDGARARPGIYFYRASMGSSVVTRQLLLLGP